MGKIVPNKPVLVMLYGYPGCGKTNFARQLSDVLQAVHVQSDRIRYELFENPRYDKQENEAIAHLTDYMTEQFLNAGISVIYDANVMRTSQRRDLRELARKARSEALLVWVQIDVESAFERVATRDRRKQDDRYTMPLDRTTFDKLIGNMQNPDRDDKYVVISGKHSFKTQLGSVVKRLKDLGLVSLKEVSANVIKPGLVNLVPAAGRVDLSRRNIVIR